MSRIGKSLETEAGLEITGSEKKEGWDMTGGGYRILELDSDEGHIILWIY